MKAILVPNNNEYDIELIAETEDENKELRVLWHANKLAKISCEQWREEALIYLY